MSWWIPFRTIVQGEGDGAAEFAVPADTDGWTYPVESAKKPGDNFWGPFHCYDCADLCGNLGKTERQAMEANHGTPDERFCALLGWA